jgi:hypothetical protein
VRCTSLAFPALVAMLGACPLLGQRPAPGPQAPDEYPVYRAILSHVARASWHVRELLVVEVADARRAERPKPAWWGELREYTSDSLVRHPLSASDSALLGVFWEAGASSLPLRADSLNIGVPVTLVATDDLPDTAWIALNAAHPARSAIVRLSRAAFSADGQRAVVMVGLQKRRGCGTGRYYFLHRIADRGWMVAHWVWFIDC